MLYYALKYTCKNGQISLLLDVKKEEQEAEGVAEIKITYINPESLSGASLGNGSPTNLHPLSLFDGNDLSLSVARELCAIHRGQITVEREDNFGLAFTVLLPVEIDTHGTVIRTVIANSEKPEDKEVSSVISKKKPLILLVEDNLEMRTYLHDNLMDAFSIVEAENGKEGWQKALSLHPNLVVSDVDMPEMNGIDLCKKIKSDNRTSHIPVILLTALGDEYSQISGLESGANDYIVKPFNTKVLASKVHNLLTLKDTLRKTYQKQVDIQSTQMIIESEDDKFVAKLIAIAEKNISDPNFSVEEFSSMMSMSRVVLYKKILAITGKTPVEFIRTMRLQKAIQLLKKSKLPIARVAYEVGYSNPNYFAKVFKEEYKMLPSQYIAAENLCHNK
jgi:YesN/AraC family two-component response regulator